jgi:hypothetical protein
MIGFNPAAFSATALLGSNGTTTLVDKRDSKSLCTSTT